MILRESIKSEIGLRLVAMTALIAVVICAFSQSIFAQQGGVANYFYDANGRLTAVLSPTGEAAIYNYDPSGNFTSITRRADNELSIIDFTPGSGGINTPVTIYGTGFSATPAANTVKFNGITATVTSATKTQLDVLVPTGATTGPISVTNTNGSITSSNQFFISSESFYFTSGINFGESVVLPNSEPNKSALLTFNGVSGQRVSILADLVTPVIGAATISLISPSAAVVATAPLQTFGGARFAFMEPQSLPANGTYSILVNPSLDTNGSDIVGMRITLYDVPPDIAGTIATSGLPTLVSFSAPGQKAVLTFNGFNGQRISLRALQSIATVFGTDIKIYSPGTYPSGSPLASSTLNSSSFIDVLTLTAGGTYTILVDPQFNKTRDATLYPYEVPADVAGAITINGSSVSFTISAPGQNAGFSFNVPGSQNLTIHIPSNTIGDPLAGLGITNTVSIVNSGGTTVFSASFSVPAGTLAVPTLSPGDYTLRINPTGPGVGSMTVNLTSP